MSQYTPESPIGDLIAGWAVSLRERELTPRWVEKATRQVERLAIDMSVTTASQITKEAVSATLARYRQSGTMGRDRRQGKPISRGTSNEYLISIRTFFAWAVEARILAENPLGPLKGLRLDGYRTFHRRALTRAELHSIVEAAKSSDRTRCRLTPLDRSMVYLTAYYTGLRLNELGSLKVENFKLDLDPPYIFLPDSAAEKSKRGGKQYLPKRVAARLRGYIAKKPPGIKVWVSEPFFELRQAARVLRADMLAAGIQPETPDGRVDFHSLRCSYITSLLIAGVPIHHAQRLARHANPTTTMKHYAKATDAELAKSASKLG